MRTARPEADIPTPPLTLSLVLGFVLFGVFAQIHGKLLALGRTPRREITEQLHRALEREEELQPLWSG